jgi:hypothetical protein
MTVGRLPSIDGGIQPTIVDAKGDLITAVAADTPARLAVGSNDQVLMADSTTATGLKWGTAGGAGKNFSLLNAGGTALTGAQTITVSGISGKDEIFIIVSGASSVNVSSIISLRLNTDTASNYGHYGMSIEPGTTYSGANLIGEIAQVTNAFGLGQMANNAGSQISGFASIVGCNSSGIKMINGSAGVATNSGVNAGNRVVGGYYNGSSTISSVSLFSSTGNFDNGTLFVYASA